MRHDDDDQHWLDLIAGRDAPEADVRTRKEAAWLRAAMLSYRIAPPSGGPADADARVLRLITRARDAGVLPPAANDSQAARDTPPTARAPRRHWPLAWAAGILACALGALWAPLHQTDDGEVLRGAAVQRLQVPDAATALSRRAEVLQTLRAAGFDAAGYERLGHLGIDLALDVPLPPRQAAVLKSLGITPPSGPSLQIEFSTPTSAP